jgi:hypothetical protein
VIWRCGSWIGSARLFAKPASFVSSFATALPEPLSRVAVALLTIVCLQDSNKISHAGPVPAVPESSSRLGLICSLGVPPDTLDERRDQHHGFVLLANN